MNIPHELLKDLPTERQLAHHQRALKTASEHLRHAGLSHARACALEDKGLHQESSEQCRMTQVFLSNALYHLQHHAPLQD